jgi:hypothetical protein
MAYLNPSVDDFKTRFVRDFPFGTVAESQVTDNDITIAMEAAIAFINPNLFQSQQFYTQNILLLSAHYLCMNLQASGQGMSGSFNWQEVGKGAGSVSQSFAIPDRILENPQYAWLSKTFYGAQFLFNILPALCGQMMTLFAVTNP